MPSIECSICSEEFGKRTDSSDVVVTPCGHVFHEMCLSKWLHHSVSSPQSPEPKTCPECRQSVTMAQTRRIYFNLSSVIDNVQNYVEYLDTVITTKNNKLHMATMQLEKLKYEWMTKIREKDYEIQRLTEKLKHREQDYEVQKLNAKIDKLKSKLRESRHKHASYPKAMTMGAVQLSMSENMGMPIWHSPEPTTHLSTMRLQQNCDASTSLFSPNLSSGQSSGASTTVQNPFECDINATNSGIRSIRNPLSTFTPGYQSQNAYLSANHIGQTFSAMMNPIQTAHATQTSQQQNQTSYTYNQTSFFVPIQATNAINATYFSTNDQNHFVGQ